ncbi:MAG: hypothetical protein QM723_13050 [Myxococcaceae bacterium]
MASLLGLVVFFTGAVVLPVAHQWTHGHAHRHGEAAVLGANEDSDPGLKGPKGGLLLHPKPATDSRSKHRSRPLWHGQGAFEHYGVATAPPAAVSLCIAAIEAIESTVQAPVEPWVDRSHQLLPLRPGAPPA